MTQLPNGSGKGQRTAKGQRDVHGVLMISLLLLLALKLMVWTQVPQTGMFGKDPTSFELPSWLAQHGGRFKAAMKTGNTVANIVLSVLERELQLPVGAFTSLHRLTDCSGDFLRVLRYPGSDTPDTVDPLRFPAHKDAVSVAILFTWLGGLQIVEPRAAPAGVVTVPEDSWRWVKPLPGCAVVNLGDAMEVFTNGVLKSGQSRRRPKSSPASNGETIRSRLCRM